MVVNGWLFLFCFAVVVFCFVFYINSVDVTVMNRPNIVQVCAFTVMSRLVGLHLSLFVFQLHDIKEGPYRLVKLMDKLDMPHSQLQLSMRTVSYTHLTLPTRR